MNETQETVARLLESLESGDRAALDELFALLYRELKELAGRQRRRWHGNYTFNTTALVHEAYVKLVGQEPIRAESRAHFRALAARAMRHILCDYARARGAEKRGGGREQLRLDELENLGSHVEFTERQSDTLVALDGALRRLEQLDPRQSAVVECRFFGGLTVEETATAMGISPRTVKRDWAMAQAWLHREMTEMTSPP
jgi:RNA polymerase sigma factor (TIGR02999 family)